MNGKRALGNSLLVLTAMLWGTAFVGQRAGMADIEPITFTAARMTLAAVAVGLVALAWGRVAGENSQAPVVEESRRRHGTIIGGVCCGAFLAAASIFQQMGIVHITAGKAGFITAMYILLVPVVSFLIFRRRTTRLVWLAVLIGVAGMYLICMTEGFSPARGDALVGISALLFSGHILCCDHFARIADPIRVSAIQFTTAAALSAVVALMVEDPSWGRIVSAAIPIVYCGLVSGGIGYTLQITAQRFTDPTVAALLLSLEAVFAVVAGAVLLGERMSPRETAGCVVMLVAIVLAQVPSRAREGVGAASAGSSAG
ncbi:EamA domain [Propionibacterium ruminifibrarum]|uniref:EamA domain n=1 Tax=Propionibacterium ruminifibrarum TaxID=1962131 RepID=A0A375I311_9ACTN|nr:DMT family transporter [Propionibacterium ruminifibrarum]SPF67612.1 EamA domain [Propionibacterium ruminifibrarum]